MVCLCAPPDLELARLAGVRNSTAYLSAFGVSGGVPIPFGDDERLVAIEASSLVERVARTTTALAAEREYANIDGLAARPRTPTPRAHFALCSL